MVLEETSQLCCYPEGCENSMAKGRFFAADVVGKKIDGTHVYAQATAGESSAVTSRRRKLEKIPWQDTDIVEIIQLFSTMDPEHARRKQWFFRVHKLCMSPMNKVYRIKWATLIDAVQIKSEWFKKFKED